ncbi:MAG: LamG-like jellyroll fold domain-containing protein [Bacillota bacterium]
MDRERISKLLVCALIVVWSSLPLRAEIAYFVKPDGNDASSGTTPAEAFATLARARDAIRQRQPIAEDTVVYVLPGLYHLSATLELTEKDSAPEGRCITYRAQNLAHKPRLSAGRIIKGPWQDEGNGIWSCDAGDGNFRQLYINGKPAITARDPNVGQWRQLKQWEPMTNSIRLQGSGILKQWQRMEQVELVVKKHWAISRIHFKGFGTYDGDDVLFPTAKAVELEYKQANVPPKANGQYYFFENALEFLDQPGEFYLDRKAHRLYYMPRPGEDLANAEIIVPRIERMVTLKGTSNVTFDGLIFEHDNWLHADSDRGYSGAQCNVHWDGWSTNPGAIQLTGTRNIHFVNNIVRNTTAGGLILVKGTQKTLIEGNIFAEIGDTPIVVYAEQDKMPTEANQCRDDLIRNNVMGGYGRQNFAASGICVSVATRCTVEHNEVFDGGYAGITYGYFSKHESPAIGSRIQFNHVHHVMKELDDGAGIYVFTTQFNLSNSTLLVYRNFIHDVYRGATAEANPIAGIYLDECSSGNTLRENVIRSVGNSFHLNTGGQDGGARRDRQVWDGNTDENAAWEKEAGLEAAYAGLCPHSEKPAAVFEKARLVRHYPLDGNVNDIVGGKHGTAGGGAGFDTIDKAQGSGSLKLDGKSGYATLPEIDLGDRFTISLWVWMPEKAFGERGILSLPTFKVYAVPDIAPFIELLRTETSDGKEVHGAATHNHVLPRGRWNHVAITVDRRHNAQRVYVNGQDVTYTDHLSKVFSPIGPIELGRYSADPKTARYLEGKIDDLRIYSGHLRPCEIQALGAAR